MVVPMFRWRLEVDGRGVQLRCMVEVLTVGPQWRGIVQVHSGGVQYWCTVEVHIPKLIYG